MGKVSTQQWLQHQCAKCNSITLAATKLNRRQNALQAWSMSDGHQIGIGISRNISPQKPDGKPGPRRTRQRRSGPVCDRPSASRPVKNRLQAPPGGGLTRRNGPGRARTVAHSAGAALTGAVRTGPNRWLTAQHRWCVNVSICRWLLRRLFQSSSSRTARPRVTFTRATSCWLSRFLASRIHKQTKFESLERINSIRETNGSF